MTSRRIALFVLLASVCLLQGCMLHRSPASIQGSLLKQTPIGTDYEVVEAFVKMEGWKPTSHSGLWVPSGTRGTEEIAGNAPTVDVRQTMHAYIGQYGGLLPFYWHEVYGYWLFDKNNKLAGVYVFKRIMDL